MSINGANRLGSNSLPELLVFGARAGRAAAAFAAANRRRAAVLLAGRRRARPAGAPLSPEARRPGEDRRSTGGNAAHHGACGRHLSLRGITDGAADKLHELQERSCDIHLDDRGRLFNTELISALELGFMLEIAETMVESAMERTESRGAHQRTDYPARNDERFLAHSMVYRDAAGRPQVEYLPGHHHALASRRAGVRKGNAEWRTGSRSRSHATIPTTRPRASRSTSYEVPLHKEWVVLDALNCIKDHLDGSLTFRWSCRMGVCGSCGMMVNGDTEAGLRHVPLRLCTGPRARRADAPTFPILRDLVVDTSDFLMKLAPVKPWIIRTDEKPMDREYLPDAGTAGGVQTVQHVHQLPAVLRRLSRSMAWTPSSVGPAAIALAQRYNMDSP